MATNKAFPPIIESRLPAQKGNTLSIPFQHSPGVGNVNSMTIKIKQITTNTIVATFDTEVFENNIAIFTIDEENIFQVGQHYKAQLAYVIDGQIGYYSTVGIFKYTGNPTVSISSNGQELEVGKTSLIGETIIGTYVAPSGDPSEKEYSYCFNVYKDGKPFATSGEKLHNYEANEEFLDEFEFNYILDSLSTYAIEYVVITTNNLTVSTGKRYIWQGAEIPIPESNNFELKAIPNYDNGSVELKVAPIGNEINKFSGQFRVLRYSSLDNYSTKEVISKFGIDMYIDEPLLVFTDYTVQQGVNYRYSIQQYSNNLYSQEIKATDTILADFEDLFLYDGNRQLKIKFNPKVSSFKETILESKLDTIGGKYPFVFRNGRTRYKEIPISGLISYWMDEEGTFMDNIYQEEVRTSTNSDDNYTDIRSTNLTSDNFTKERQFKLEVLSWLNNGQPKLFRSPAEGNYIVRIMNVSLSPDEKLGRMLHTFNATAYEIAEHNYSNLISYKFIGADSSNLNVWNFYTEELEASVEKTILPAHWLRLYGNPGDVFTLWYSDNKFITISIGYSGLYENDFEEPIVKVSTNRANNKIEYATYEIQDTGLSYRNASINSIRREERVYSSIINSDNEFVDILAKDELGLEENEVLENILILKLEAVGDGGLFILNGVEISLNTNTFNNIQTSGRIEYTAKDFNGKFVPTELKIEGHIRVDIYYRVIVME